MTTNKPVIHKLTEFKGKEDCCSDRSASCWIAWQCTCGFKGCISCTENHAMEVLQRGVEERLVLTS